MALPTANCQLFSEEVLILPRNSIGNAQWAIVSGAGRLKAQPHEDLSHAAAAPFG
jgi:hypothetical protein